MFHKILSFKIFMHIFDISVFLITGAISESSNTLFKGRSSSLPFKLLEKQYALKSYRILSLEMFFQTNNICSYNTK